MGWAVGVGRLVVAAVAGDGETLTRGVHALVVVLVSASLWALTIAVTDRRLAAAADQRARDLERAAATHGFLTWARGRGAVIRRDRSRWIAVRPRWVATLDGDYVHLVSLARGRSLVARAHPAPGETDITRALDAAAASLERARPRPTGRGAGPYRSADAPSRLS